MGGQHHSGDTAKRGLADGPEPEGPPPGCATNDVLQQLGKFAEHEHPQGRPDQGGRCAQAAEEELPE